MLEGILICVFSYGSYLGARYYFIPLAKLHIEKRRAKRHGPKKTVDTPKRDRFDIVE